MNEQYLPLFVYGTLQLSSRGYGSSLAPSVIASAPAFWSDADMWIGSSYPFAVPAKNATGIHGQVLLLNPDRFPSLLDQLDSYEGYLGEGRSDNLYMRRLARVKVTPQSGQDWPEDTENLLCYVYIASPETMETERGQLLRSPSGKWANHEQEWAELSPSLDYSE